MPGTGGNGTQPGFLEADTVTQTHYDNVFGAVSANYVRWEDVQDDEWAAQIRMRAGVRAYQKDKIKKAAMLNMAFSAAYMLATSDRRFTYDSFKANDETFHKNYLRAFAALTGTKEEDSEKSTSAAQDMMNLYNYLFT